MRIPVAMCGGVALRGPAISPCCLVPVCKGFTIYLLHQCHVLVLQLPFPIPMALHDIDSGRQSFNTASKMRFVCARTTLSTLV